MKKIAATLLAVIIELSYKVLLSPSNIVKRSGALKTAVEREAGILSLKCFLLSAFSVSRAITTRARAHTTLAGRVHGAVLRALAWIPA